MVEDNDDSDTRKQNMDEEGCNNGEVSPLLLSSQFNLELSLEQKCEYVTKNKEQTQSIASSAVAHANNANAGTMTQRCCHINEINKTYVVRMNNNNEPAQNGPTIT